MPDQWLSMSEVSLGRMLTLHSKCLGENRQVYVRLPKAYAQTDRRYPVLVVLDGELARFTAYSGAVALASEWEDSVPELILVAIPNMDRFRDMLPSAVTLPGGRENRGKANAFLRFLHDELLSLIDRTYRTHPFRILAGTSASGLTVLYEMMTNPGRFSAYLASSPSLQWDTEHAIRQLGQINGNAISPNTALALWCGENDNPGIRDACESYRDALLTKSIPGLRFDYSVYPGEGHCPSDGFRQGLCWTFSTWAVPDPVLDEGVDAVRRHYRQLSEDVGFSVELSASAHGALTFRWLARGQIEAALSWISQASHDMPGSPDLAFFHGSALFRDGRQAEAHALVADALRSHPGNGRLITLLRQIESLKER